MAEGSRLNVVYKYFGKAPANDQRPSAGTLTTFRDEWKDLTDADKNQLQQGIEDGSLTY